uniref:Uncharacterized protein n=1 Tax=Attheya septentrionalis TaxID=420275 RepID=A0A7S2UH43_9STRA|mmetsp:Transcript_23034/g.41568  ORF Transcript_23034/g.41568 Transcript_23034/m.41568 type:complete len:265 (+) Transcript_23034:100-894(+)|eukprot:CAMPEP_0198301838 /NCGR_PEP_ID=MMETSP1449-20131203/53077_1 /TAXON_ID=420275 /ORGANISM="Attheya septentrionalis, Strain CCMP2084" /LENGTH=264 /DNA_ID=CAMNT_0044004009 /DNA_START=92 /DNA_END=886 /DNA_ORIENTATION=-
MMELSLSMVAWMAVVLLQAFIHFGVIGPRSRQKRRESEIEPMEATGGQTDGESPGTEDTGMIIPTSPTSTNSTTEDSRQMLLSTMANDMDGVPELHGSADESDCTSHNEPQTSLSESFGNYPSINEEMEKRRHVLDSKRESPKDFDFLHENPASDYGDESDCDLSFREDYEEDEEERLRYELIQDYYSHSDSSFDPPSSVCYQDETENQEPPKPSNLRSSKASYSKKRFMPLGNANSSFQIVSSGSMEVKRMNSKRVAFRTVSA